MNGVEPLDSRVSNTNASTDSTTKQKKESKMSLRKNRERRRASKEASTSPTSSSAAQKSDTAHNATFHDSKKASTSSTSSAVAPKSDIMHSLYHSSKPKIELTTEIVTIDDSKNTKVKKQSILSSSKTKGMMESSEDSTSSSSKFKSANHNSSSEQIPCDSANVTNVQITSIDEVIDQMKTIVNSNNTITERMVPTHVLLGWISTLQQHNDSPGTKLTIQKKPLNDISNTCTDELSQEQLKEIYQETDEEIPQLIVRDEDEDPDPVYVPRVWTKPFDVEMVPDAQFPGKPVVDYHGSDEESKTLLINNFGLYYGVLQKTDLNRHTSMSYQERKDLPQKEIEFANGDVIDLPLPLIESLFDADGKPKWSSELYLLTKEDAYFLKILFLITGWVVPPLCGDLGAGLATLRLLIVEIGTFQCPEDTTTRLTQVEVIKHICRIVEGAFGKVGFCNVESFLPMVHSKFLTYYKKDKELAETKFKDDKDVQRALQIVKDGLDMQRTATKFIMEHIQQPAFLKAKEMYHNPNLMPGSDFSSEDTEDIGIETQFIFDCMEGKLDVTEAETQFILDCMQRKIKDEKPTQEDEQEAKELTKLQKEFLNQCKYPKKSCLDGSCDFVKTSHFCANLLASGAVKDVTKEEYKKDISKKAHNIGKVIDVNYSHHQMELQLNKRDKKQSMSNITQFLLLSGIATKRYEQVRAIMDKRRLESIRNNALERGEDVQDGKFFSDQSTGRRLQSTRNNALERGDDVQDGKFYSEETTEKRLQSTRNNAEARGETILDGKFYSEESTEKRLQNVLTNAEARGETILDGKFYSEETTEKRLQSTRTNAEAKGEMILDGKFYSKETTEKRLQSTRTNAEARGETILDGKFYSEESTEKRLQNARNHAEARGETILDGKFYSEESTEKRLQNARNHAEARGETILDGKFYSEETTEKRLQSTRTNAEARGETILDGKFYSEETLGKKRRAVWTDEMIDRKNNNSTANAAARGETVLSGQIYSLETKMKQSKSHSTTLLQASKVKKDGSFEVVGHYDGPMDLCHSTFAKENLTKNFLCSKDDEWGVQQIVLDNNTIEPDKFVRNRFRGNTRKGEDGQEFVFFYCIKSEKIFCLERFQKTEIDDADWSNCAEKNLLYGKGTKPNIQNMKAIPTKTKLPRTKKPQSKKPTTTQSKSVQATQSKSSRKRKSPDGNNNSKSKKNKQSKQGNLKDDTKY
ncbi:hypothetical protein CTEN210_10436 [Chaetoceros tenuissimus]|uniref:Uncharacterized protein n=1 Tax=Chaetoceros tenuissimus TaxID=426638 RepID=A0AAD3H860_9STRA|nr:hypothetical protein CTEN210_10436 [Chaetoceros tenuissimus]